jgi:hypothetical protein
VKRFIDGYLKIPEGIRGIYLPVDSGEKSLLDEAYRL